MSAMKCPNPGCPFLFDAARVPPGAVITCPQCAFRFQLQQAVAPPAPALGGENPALAGLLDAPPADEPRPKPARRKSPGFGSSLMAVAGAVGVLIVIFGGLAIALLSKSGGPAGRPANTGEFRKTDLNFAFAKPPAPWAEDNATQNAVGANVLGYKRTGPDAWFALSVRDYGTRQPRPSELIDRVKEQLAKGFDNVPAELEPENVTWGGQPAQKVGFRAVPRGGGEAVVGECRALGHQGIGYWLLTWCAEKDEAAAGQELAAIRDGFRVLEERTSWRPAQSQEVVHRGPAGEYQITDYERIWAPPKGKLPADEDDKGDFLLRGTLKGPGRRDFVPTADLVVLILDGDDPALARKYVEERLKSVPETAITDVDGAPEGDPPAAGPEGDAASVVRLKATRGGADAVRTADKLVVFKALPLGGKLVVAEATCPWRERAVWERRLVQLAGSLEAAK